MSPPSGCRSQNSVAAAAACPMNMMLLFTVLVSLKVSAVSASSIDSLMLTVGSCEMNCEHGFCEMVQGDQELLQHLFQSGQLLQHCSCPYGWTGTGCELEVEQCDVNSMTCPNGTPCTNEHGAYNCDCSVANSLSKLARQQCRRPYTDYCSATYDPNKPLSFCTNGGVCRASVMAAEVAPGNTTVNALYEHEGCICPPEYYGPHCEFIHRSLPQTSVEQEQIVATAPEKPTSPAAVLDPSKPQEAASSSSTTTTTTSINDLIRGYNGVGDNGNAGKTAHKTTEAADSSSNWMDKTMIKLLLGFVGLVLLGIACVGVMMLRLRKLRQNPNFLKRRRPKDSVKDGNSVATKSVTTLESTNQPKYMHKLPRKMNHADPHPVPRGSSDPTAFALEDEEDVNVPQVTATSTPTSWMASIHQHMDAFVGTSKRYHPTPDDNLLMYKVDDDDDEDDTHTDVLSDIYSVNESLSQRHPYMVEEDEPAQPPADRGLITTSGVDNNDDDNCLWYPEPNQSQPAASLWGDAWD